MKKQILMFCWWCHEMEYVEKGRWNKEDPYPVSTSDNISNSSTSRLAWKTFPTCLCMQYVLLSSYYINIDTGY